MRNLCARSIKMKMRETSVPPLITTVHPLAWRQAFQAARDKAISQGFPPSFITHINLHDQCVIKQKPKMFCKRCDNILRHREEPLGFFDNDRAAFYIYHATFQSLKAAVINDCRVCYSLINNLINSEKNDKLHQIPKN